MCAVCGRVCGRCAVGCVVGRGVRSGVRGGVCDGVHDGVRDGVRDGVCGGMDSILYLKGLWLRELSSTLRPSGAPWRSKTATSSWLTGPFGTGPKIPCFRGPARQ